MDSIVSEFHQYVSGTAIAGSCEERDLCQA
jgi:hypothetical protein